MSKKGRKLFTIILIVILALMIILPTVAMIISYARAETSDEIQARIDSLKESAQGLSDRMEELQGEIDTISVQELSTSELKEAQDRQIELTRSEIENTVAQMQQYGLLIAAKQDELDEAEEQMRTREQQLNSRIRAMEEYGDTSYLAIIFQATDFEDLLGRLEMVRDLMTYEKSVLTAMAEAREKMDAARASLEENKAAVAESRALLEEQELELQSQLEQSQELLMKLHKEKQDYAREYEAVEAQENELWDQIDVLVEEYSKKKAEEEEAARLAALKALEEQKRREEEEAERRRQEEEANRRQESSGSYDSSDDWGDDYYYYTGSGTDESFAWPVDCYEITCPYGMRLHPILGVWKLHTGVDIGAWYGQTITAAKGGWVVASDENYAYGNYVVVSHGDGVTTLYAHMSERAVSQGDYVVQGSVLGYVGSTGYSTGPHLHYEIRIDGDYTDPLDYYSLTFTMV
ncbi:MAG: peptidoglycan DD-metalloendopeptidase family protein [Oscillospiraceae bacterium]|nr:peptidoglycan DD-metalloendopeptidase family protein [Oscillospiraceae bacterium]